MKNSLMVFALSIITSSALANVVEIENKSDYALKGWVSLLGVSCPPRSLKKLPLEIAAHSTKKVPSKDCCAYTMELRVSGKGRSGTWGGGDLAILPALVTVGVSAIRVCGKSEKFQVMVNANHEPIITNVTGKK